MRGQGCHLAGRPGRRGSRFRRGGGAARGVGAGGTPVEGALLVCFGRAFLPMVSKS